MVSDTHADLQSTSKCIHPIIVNHRTINASSLMIETKKKTNRNVEGPIMTITKRKANKNTKHFLIRKIERFFCR